MNQNKQKAAIIILASGQGLRAGGSVPKQYRIVGSKPVLSYSLEIALNSTDIEHVVLVLNEQDKPLWQPIITGLDHTRIHIVYGGVERQISVANGLEALVALNIPQETVVLIHDSARPFISEALLQRAIEAGKQYDAAIPVLPVTDTIKQVDLKGAVVATLPRADLRNIQTPQAFELGTLLAAHNAAKIAGLFNFTDDAGIVEWCGGTIYSFAGDPKAFKITTEADFTMAEYVASQQSKHETRVATGYDVHAFGTGDHVWLGGVKIPHNHCLIGHSDADPVLHAMTDALLGTLGDGDIGSHFPPSDPQWKGASSHIFLKAAINLMHKRGGHLVHLDATIICEFPQIGPHRDVMRQTIADICGVALNRISLKATTSEKLGFTGRGEGIAAFATATIELPA